MNEQTAIAPEQAQEPAQWPAELTADALIEEVSIDGMCGVY